MFTFERKANYYETDQMGIVHHSNYIRWFEEARLEMLRAMGLPYKKMEDNGILIPVDDEDALTGAMEHMMLRREDYDSAAISADIRRKFAPETIAARLTELYEGVLSC